MELSLINTELTESKLYRANSMGKRLYGEEVSKLLFLNTLALVLLYKDRGNRAFAQKYAKDTRRYGNYTLYRTSGNDLYTLAYHVEHPHAHRVSTKDGEAGADLLDSLQFNSGMHLRMLMHMADGSLKSTNEYLQRLATQLKIRDGRYGVWRRQVANYDSLSGKERNALAKNISTELYRIAKPQELQARLGKIYGSSTLKKAVTTAAGAYLGHEIAKKANVNKTVGTGLGAIAGYWAGK